jgi:PIN domain nuclease of toxin-antitoxin system
MLVLDTHVLLWWLGDEKKLSIKAKRAITEAQKFDSSIVVSAITAWEIAMLVEKGRLTLSTDITAWLHEVELIDAVKFMPVDNEIAIQSTQLPGEFHRDPADRLIVALTRHLSFQLVTADDKIRAYRHVKTIW